MSTRRDRPRPTPFRALPTGPTAFLLGTREEIAVLEPLTRQAGMGAVRQILDPFTLDIETVVLDEGLAEQVARAAMAIVIADVVGDDRLPLISFVDDSLAPQYPLLVSCTQAGATEQAAICQHRERVVGIGLLGLLSGRKVIEVAPALTTSAAILRQAGSF